MNHQDREEIEQIVDERVSRTEQKLLNLVTRDEFESAMVAAKADLREGLESVRKDLRTVRLEAKADLQEGLGTVRRDLETVRLEAKADLREGLQSVREDLASVREDLRRHFDVVGESIRGEIRLLAEGQSALATRLDGHERETERRFAKVDDRLTRVEAQLRRTRKPPKA